jgi:hypothetical protein
MSPSLLGALVAALLGAAAPAAAASAATNGTSILGDPGMLAATPAVALSLWSFCNYAAAPSGYPLLTTRMADCPGQVRPAGTGPSYGQATVAVAGFFKIEFVCVRW